MMENAGLSTGVLTVLVLISLAVAIFYIICYWRVFEKAGEPGWAYIVPIYNAYVLFKISMGNGWLFLLCFVPIANIIIVILQPLGLAKAFDKGTSFGLGLLFLPIIFYPILAFGDADYVGR